jgi:hypothetical protein
LVYPFSGFLVVWLLYPLSSVAAWLPWAFLATDRVLIRPSPGSFAELSLVVAAVFLGGHVQTSAHVLLAVGVYGLIRQARERTWAWLGWVGGVGLGLLIAAAAILPLAGYLSRSPVWADRLVQKRPSWEFERPRLLDSACTGLPYLHGSQRRGHPSLGKALGVNNLNESAGGFAGLATLIWLAPLGVQARWGDWHVRVLAGLGVVGFFGAFQLPPVSNLFRALPVLDVIDQRRLTLWLAFCLPLLGGIGLDRLEAFRIGRAWRGWISLWALVALGFAVAAGLVPRFESTLRARARAHYAASAERMEGEADRVGLLAERQVRAALVFVPGYLGGSAGHLAVLAALAVALSGGGVPARLGRPILFGVVLVDLAVFGVGLNPAIAPDDDRPVSPVIEYLQKHALPPARIVAIGSELPPNLLPRYGLADVRNYDSVELARAVDWFAPLYEDRGPTEARTSRRWITWEGVRRASDRLRVAGVAAVVGATPPPPGLGDRVVPVGSVWVVHLEADQAMHTFRSHHGIIEIDLTGHPGGPLVVPEMADDGWRAEVDGRPISARPGGSPWLSVEVGRGHRVLRLHYDPVEARVGLALSAGGLAITAVSLVVATALWTRKMAIRAWSDRENQDKIEVDVLPGPLRPVPPRRTKR